MRDFVGINDLTAQLAQFRRDRTFAGAYPAQDADYWFLAAITHA